MSEVKAIHKDARISPKKVAPVMDLIRGKDLLDAKVILAFDPTKAAAMVLKVLKSAEANAKTNNKFDETKLYVSELHVHGASLKGNKRGRIVAKSRFSPILKRTSHIVVGLSHKENN